MRDLADGVIKVKNRECKIRGEAAAGGVDSLVTGSYTHKILNKKQKADVSYCTHKVIMKN